MMIQDFPPDPFSSIEPLEARIAPAFAAGFHLAGLNGHNGLTLIGADGDAAGVSVSDAGDFNGDGIDDIVIGAIWARSHGVATGAAYIIFGKRDGFDPNLDLSALDGHNGFKISGAAFADSAGYSVSGAGDVNGDGFADVIVGADGADSAGAAYVIFGKAGAFARKLNLAALDGQNGFKLKGVATGDLTGISVSGAGDVNADGFSDVIVGAVGALPNGVYSGAAYIVFGKAGGITANLDLGALDGMAGYKLSGPMGVLAGRSVSGAGDVNGDGFADVIVGAYGASPHGFESGAAYVVFGKASGFAANLDLSELDGSSGFKINGVAAYDKAGLAVSGAGDINGDGLEDVIVATEEAHPTGGRTGAADVVFGKTSAFAPALDLSSLDGGNGFSLSGERSYDGAGSSVGGAGDINGDGFADFIVGANGADSHGFDSGTSYLVFGKAAGFSANLELSTLDGHTGFKLIGVDGGDYSGRSVGGGGDFNGDGFPDIIVGAGAANPNGVKSGAAYVVFGGDPARLQIAYDGHSATFTDPDGDRVTVQTSAGVFTKAMFDLRAEGLGFQLETLHLTDAAFAKANLTFSAVPENVDGLPGREGDGFMNLGFLDATGIDLGKVKIAGDLGRIDAGNPADPGPALTLLSLQHLGKQGATTQNAIAASLHSDLAGSLTTLKVAHGIHSGVTLAIAGKLGTATLGGNLTDATLSVLGKLTPADAAHALAIASLTVGGSVLHSQILAGYDLTGAAVNADASIGSVIVCGTWSASSLAAGIADSTGDGFGQNDTLIPGGDASIIASIANVLIKGRASGSMATGDFYGITAEQIDSASIARIPLALTANKDTLPLDPANADFWLVEI